MIVAKFGGTSMADEKQISKVIKIIQANPERTCIVVSAPGKRHANDEKMTDTLTRWKNADEPSVRTQAEWQFQKRFTDLRLGVEMLVGSAKMTYKHEHLCRDLDEIIVQYRKFIHLDYIVSRGEYLMAKILAGAIGYDFIDPAKCLFLDHRGNHSGNLFSEAIAAGQKVVVPGFYGTGQNGFVQTFPRGGSDITGSILAAELGAEVYENWTDVSGVLMADPKAVENPRQIREVSFREMRELSYMGANVLHEEALFPLMGKKIPVNIRNTNDPTDAGTRIVVDVEGDTDECPITGIAGRKDFTIITVEKRLMNQQVGFAAKILDVLKQHQVNLEHMPSGIDTLSVIIDQKQLGNRLGSVLEHIEHACQPENIRSDSDIALIAVVGRRMRHKIGVSATIFTAFATAGVNVRSINQGSSEISIIIGVQNADYENAVRALYAAFTRE